MSMCVRARWLKQPYFFLQNHLCRWISIKHTQHPWVRPDRTVQHEVAGLVSALLLQIVTMFYDTRSSFLMFWLIDCLFLAPLNSEHCCSDASASQDLRNYTHESSVIITDRNNNQNYKTKTQAIINQNDLLRPSLSLSPQMVHKQSS